MGLCCSRTHESYFKLLKHLSPEALQRVHSELMVDEQFFSKNRRKLQQAIEENSRNENERGGREEQRIKIEAEISEAEKNIEACEIKLAKANVEERRQRHQFALAKYEKMKSTLAIQEKFIELEKRKEEYARKKIEVCVLDNICSSKEENSNFEESGKAQIEELKHDAIHALKEADSRAIGYRENLENLEAMKTEMYELNEELLETLEVLDILDRESCLEQLNLVEEQIENERKDIEQRKDMLAQTLCDLREYHKEKVNDIKDLVYEKAELKKRMKEMDEEESLNLEKEMFQIKIRIEVSEKEKANLIQKAACISRDLAHIDIEKAAIYTREQKLIKMREDSAFGKNEKSETRKLIKDAVKIERAKKKEKQKHEREIQKYDRIERKAKCNIMRYEKEKVHATISAEFQVC